LKVEQNTLFAFLLLRHFCSADSKESLLSKHLHVDKQQKR